jgi:glutamate dehydrogenase
MALTSESTVNLRRNLREIAEQQHLSARIGEFLDGYFVDVELGGATDASPEELLGAAVQHFRLGEVRAPKQAAAALYTPDFDRHGWHSPHTVIDVVTDDMPFLVDSITMLVYHHGLVIHRLLHPLLGAEREGRWHAAGHAAAWRCRQSAGVLDPPRDRSHWRGRTDRAPCIRKFWACSLTCVRPSKMARRCTSACAQAHTEMAAVTLAESRRSGGISGLDRGQQFCLSRLCGLPGGRRRQQARARVAGSGLGILRSADHPRFGRCLAGIPGVVAELARDPLPVILVKADARSTVHRSAYLDFIAAKRYDADGNIVGLRAFVGLYTAHVYHVAATDAPLLRRKIAAVREDLGFLPRSHRDKTLLNVLETYPRDELIEIAHHGSGPYRQRHRVPARARAGAHLPARRCLGALCFGDRLYAARPFRHHHPRAHLGAPS